MAKYSELKDGSIFKAGIPNPYSQYFVGQTYLSALPDSPDGQFGVGVVTFEPGARNNWHIHHDGYQMLLVTKCCWLPVAKAGIKKKVSQPNL